MDSPDPRPLPGGPLALDLLNTTWESAGHAVDWLDADNAVQSFVASWDQVVTDDQIDAARIALVEARELTRRAFASTMTGDISNDLMSEMNAVLSGANAKLIATPDGPKLSISSDEATLALAVEAIVSAIGVLDDRPDRIRSCEHGDCVLWFVDTSKAGRRRWCSMERCGNRAKARRHYERATKQGPQD